MLEGIRYPQVRFIAVRVIEYLGGKLAGGPYASEECSAQSSAGDDC